jgi:putative endonuclease
LRRGKVPRAGTARTGARAEQLAQRWLESRGLRLVARNFRCRAGELDLVMLEGRELVVIEVRYRATDRLVHPALTVSALKRRRLLQAAARFLQLQECYAGYPVRFDVLALIGPFDGLRCEWISRAFTADDVDGF